MNKRVIGMVLAVALFLGLLGPLAPRAQAATASKYEPYAVVDYDYSETVECGTIRYVAQKPDSSKFYAEYWGEYEERASYNCSTSCISMALSYIGINTTPEAILDHNILTVFYYGYGGSTPKSYTYDNLDVAVDNYVNGEGKYSPPVIHLDNYSVAGHYVMLLGRVDDNQYQVLDPATLTIWNITINGATATYNNPYGGGTITDSIDNTGTGDVYQWYNSSAKLPGDLSACTKYPSYCTLTVNAAADIMNLPFSSAYSGSAKIGSVSANETVTAIQLLKNTSNEYWYKITTAGGITGYIPAAKTTYVSELTDDITIRDVEAPVVLIRGGKFPAGGTIISKYNDLTVLSAYVYTGTGIDGSVATGGKHAITTRYYSLKGSTVDNQLIFRLLPVGTYTYAVFAEYTNSYVAANGTRSTNTGRVCLYSGPLIVSSDGNEWVKIGSQYTYYEKGVQVSGKWIQDTYWYYIGTDGYMKTNSWVMTADGAWCYVDAAGRMVTSAWQQIGGKWYYFNADGYMTTGWQKVSGKWYYMNSSGVMQTGWQQIDGKWYYLKNEMKTGWQLIGGKWYYMNSSGVMQTGWQKVGGKWYYMNSSGVMQTGWQQIDGKWYYLNGSGAMQTGWVQVGDNWYYLNTDRKTGWLQLGTDRYYLNSDGVRQTGWLQMDEGRYYLDGNGVMQTGWVQVAGARYYLNDSGLMQTGWQKVDGSWYYLNASGVMQTGWQLISGKWYYMNSSGVMQTGWVQVGGLWYYLNGSGVMLTGWQKIDGQWYYLKSARKTGWLQLSGKWYYLDDNGVMQTGWVELEEGRYYLNDSGVMQTGWQKIDGQWYYLKNVMQTGWQKINAKWYYLGTDGIMVTGTHEIDGKTYTFDANGVWID